MKQTPDHAPWQPLADDSVLQRRGRLWIAVPAIVSLLGIAVLYYRQAVLNVPVPTRPLTGDVVPGLSLYLDWNTLADPTRIVHVQVSEARNFDWIAFEARTDPGAERLRRSRVLKPSTSYYWRMRTIDPDGHSSPWTRAIRFHTK